MDCARYSFPALALFGAMANDRFAPVEQDKILVPFTTYALDMTPQARILLSVYPENSV